MTVSSLQTFSFHSSHAPWRKGREREEREGEEGGRRKKVGGKNREREKGKEKGREKWREKWREKEREEGKNGVMREKLEGREGRSGVKGPQKLTAQFGDEQGWTHLLVFLGAFFLYPEGKREREREEGM